MENGSVIFVDDLPNGGCILQCKDCGSEFVYRSTLEKCPICGEDIDFPKDVDW